MNAPAQATSLQAMRQTQEQTTAVSMGFGNLQSFELMQRAAKLLSSSTLVPAAYRFWDEKKGAENPNALANCVVSLNMAQRMGADPLMVMQNLYIVEGRPSWSSQWIIAAINGCGRFSPLRFDLKDLGTKEVEYEVTKWVDRQRVTSKHKATVQNLECVAWAIERETGARIDSPKVSIEMAVKEGWYGKSGSKWQTMPEVMLRYRTASFFGKLYAPELLMGLQSAEEVHDIIDINADGTVAGVTSESLRTRNITPEAKTTTVDQATGEVIEPEAKATPAEPAVENTDETQFKKISESLKKATDTDVLDVAADLIGTITDQAMRDELSAMYQHRRDQLENPPTGDAPAPSRARRDRSTSASME